jgi:hypothetical protein
MAYVPLVIWQGEAGKKPQEEAAAFRHFCVYLVVSVVMVSKLSCKIGSFHDENNVFFGGNNYH